MYHFLKKNRWIPSLHLLVVAMWILVGSIIAGYTHKEVRQPKGVLVVTDFAGDDLQRLAGSKELSKELNVETEGEEASESDLDPPKFLALDDARYKCDLKLGLFSARQNGLLPSRAKFPNPKVLYLEYEVFRI
ncbi:MAG: hypothetical protein RL206_158 [Bacteroidota bacterium]|jgi:hypothetical protein